MTDPADPSGDIIPRRNGHTQETPAPHSERGWLLAAARGDFNTERALAAVRTLHATREHWADTNPELDQALTEGDQRHPNHDRWPTPDQIAPWKPDLDPDPATNQAFRRRILEGRVTLTTVSTVERERVRWLWPGRLPLGKLVTCDGDPDVGKSTLMLDLAARITTGRPMPEEDLAAIPASNVVLLAAEDGLADTIRPRLDAAGADCSRVHHVDSVPLYSDDGELVGDTLPSIPENVDALDLAVRSTQAVLVIVDVLMAYLSGRANSHKDQDVRRALAPLSEMAKDTGACIVLIRHLRKARGSAIYAGGGSVGIVGVARAGLIAATDPTDETGTRHILARGKGNLAPPWPSLAYMLTEDPDLGVARVEWLGTTSITADQLLEPPPVNDDDDMDDATAALRAVLADGPLWVKEAVDRMIQAGFTRKQARRAKEKLGVRSAKCGKPGDADQGWKWELPARHSYVEDALYLEGAPERAKVPEGAEGAEGAMSRNLGHLGEGAEGVWGTDVGHLGHLGAPSGERASSQPEDAHEGAHRGASSAPSQPGQPQGAG